MDWMDWYDSLSKPAWTPSPAVIGWIWRILYPVIAVSFIFVFVQAVRGQIPRRCAIPFALNLLANLAFIPILFGLRLLPLAAIDVLIVWGTILWMIVAVWQYYRWVAIVQLPYLAWVSIATVLQLSITAMNWRGA